MRPTTAGLGALLIVTGTGCALSQLDAPFDAGVVECFEADYELEPTFDSPEDAVADALVTEASLGEMPGALDDYERIEPSSGRVDFAFRESDDDYVTWSTRQDDDGQWGVASVSACRPDGI